MSTRNGRGWSRRGFLKALLAGAAGAATLGHFGVRPAWAKLPKGLKITEIKTFLVGNSVFVKVYTSEGVTGLGEGSFTGRAKTIEAAISEHARLLAGKDPTDIERLWHQMFRWPRARGGAMLSSAVAAIDIALWDIAGKLLDVPIYKLLGGAARDRVRLYAHVQAGNVEAIAAKVAKAKEEGFTAVRSGLAFLEGGKPVERPWNLEKAVAVIQAMRDAAGKDVDILDDAHGMLSTTQVLEYAKAIAPCRLLFLEDPVQPENLDGLRWLGSKTDIPIGIGESIYTKFGFQEIIADRLASYVRPDVIHAGGITEVRKIAAMAAGNFVDVALHVGVSPVSNLAAAHVAAATDNCAIVEITGHPSRRGQQEKDLFGGGDIVVEKGYALLPEKPGLGCDLNEEIAAKIPYRENDLPRLQYEDGTPINW